MAVLLPRVSTAVLYDWDPDGNSGNSNFGGSGVWNTTSLFWDDNFDGNNNAWPNSLLSPNDARFYGTPGTVSLGAPIVAQQLLFQVSGYQLTNGGNSANTLTLAGPAAGFQLDSGTLTTGVRILGSDGLFKLGSGTLVLSDTANAYSGTTRIFAGTIETNNLPNVGAPSSIGVGGDALDIYGYPNIAPYLMFDGGTLRYIGTGTSTNRTFIITNRGGAIDSSGTGTSLGFNTASAGILSQGTGNRTFTLTGSNTAFNNLAAPISDATDINAAVIGVTSLAKSGSGTWTMTADSQYTGSTSITGGNLIINTMGVGGAASSIGRSTNDPKNLVIDGGTLTYIGAGTTTDRSFTVGPNGATISSSGTGAMTFSNPAGSVASGTGSRTITLGGSSNVVNVMRNQIADPSTIWALNSTNTLLRFSPGSPEVFDQTLPITGLQTNEVLHSIDFRPSTGELFAFGTTGTPTAGSVNRLYTINTTTGAATLVSTVTGLTLSGGNPGSANASYGFDFNPTNDTIRVVGADRQNIRILPGAPAFSTFTTDTALTTGARIVGIAYSNNVSGASSTTLYGIDSITDSLVTINPEDGGVVTTVGPLNGGLFSAAAGDTLGFDIGSNGIAYASIQDGSVYRLYNIDLFTGIASVLGSNSANPTIGTGAAPVRDLSVAINGTTSLFKTGQGTWSLDRSGSNAGNTYSGTTTINQGTLTLNFTPTDTPRTQLINPKSGLIMAGGTLGITGKANTANIQNFNGLTLLPGGTVIAPTSGSGTGSLSMTLGTLGSRQTFASVAFVPGGAATINLDAANDVTGILGAWATYATTDWAVVNAGVVGAYASSSYANIALGGAIANGPTTHVRINSGTTGNITLGAATTTISTLVQNHTTAAVVSNANQTLRLGTVGGILVGAGRQALTIGASVNSGQLTAGGTDNTAGELLLHNNSTNLLTINSVVANNGTGQVTLVSAGTGVTVLTGANTYTGGTVLNSGTLRIADNRALSTGAITVNGSTVPPTLASNSGIGREIKNDLILNSDVQFVDATGTGGLILRGDVNLTGGTRILSVTQADGYVTLDGSITNGSFVKSGPGAMALLDIALTNVKDITIAQGSLDVWSATGLGTTPIFALNGALSASGAFYSPVMTNVIVGPNMTLGRTRVSDGIDLGGLIDLGNATLFEPRVITAAAAQPQQQQRISGTMVSGAFAKAGSGDLYITGGTSTYEGGTIVLSNAAGSSLRVSPSGRLGGNTIGNDIHVVQDPVFTPSPAITINSYAILRLESLANVGDKQTVYLNNYTDSVTPFLGWGSAFEAQQTALGFVDPFVALPGVGGLGNIRVNNTANFPVGIAIDGIRSNADSIGAVLVGVPNATVWLGATRLDGVYTGSSLSTGIDSTYHLGGGGGTLTIAGKNVLTGPNSVATGSFDALGRGITGTVFIPNAQDFTGTLSVGGGTTLVVAQNGALGSGTSPIYLYGGTLNLRTTGAHYSTDTQYAGRDFALLNSAAIALPIGTIPANGTSTLNIDPLGGGQNGRVQIGGLDFSGVVIAPTLAFNNSTSFDLRVLGPVMLIGELPGTPGTSATTTLTVNSGFVTVEGAVGQSFSSSPGANLTKAGGGMLILTQPSTHTGLTTANGGTFVLTNPNAITGVMRLQSGTLSLRSDSVAPVDFNFSAFNLLGGGTLSVGPLSPVGTAAYAGTRIRIPEINGGTQTALTVSGTLNSSLQVVSPMTIGANFTLTVNATQVDLAGGVSGNFGLTKAGNGVLKLSGAAVSSGSTSINQGFVIANHDDGTGAVDTFGSGALAFAGGSGSGGILISGARRMTKDVSNNSTLTNAVQTLGGIDAGAKTFSGNIDLGARGLTLTAEPGGDVTFSGVISNSQPVTVGSLTGGAYSGGNNGGSPASAIFNAGTPSLGRGTIILAPASASGNTFSGALTIHTGTLIGTAVTGGAPFGNGSATNSITINQATLQLNGIAASTVTQTAGALTVGGGARVLINDIADAFTTQFTVGSLARAGVGTLAYVPVLASGQETFSITAPPALINTIVAPWLVKATSSANPAGDFVTMSGNNVVAATYTGANIDASVSATAIINDADGGVLSANRAAYALKLGGTLTLGSNTLSIGDTLTAGTFGGLILNAGAGLSGGTLNVGLAEGLVYVGGASSTIGSAIVGLGATSLTKFGEGVLTLTNSANTYRGATTVGRGTLRMGAPNALGRWTIGGAQLATALTVHSNGRLELNGFDTEIGSLAGSFGAVVDAGSKRLTIGRNNTSTTFSGQLLGVAGSVLQKVGTGTLTLDNTRADGNANSFAGSIFVDQGGLTLVVADQTNGSPFAVRNSLAAGTTITLRGGTLNLRSSGDGISASNQNMAAGYHIVVGAGNSILDANRFGGTETQKTLELGNLTLGRNEFQTTGGNAIVPSIMGTVLLTDNARINTNSSELSISGLITDNGEGFTLNKVGGSNLFIGNSNNNYSGGTIVAGGNLFFGARGPDVLRFAGNTFVPSDAGRAGTGPIVLETNTVINFTDRENLGVGQTVRVLNSTVTGGNNSGFVIQTDRAVSEFNLRATGRGSLQIGVQNGTYGTPIDMSKVGDGQWGLTSGRSVETLYTASTLGAGAGNVFRFYGSSGAAFVIMGQNAVTGTGTVELGRALTDAGALAGNANASIRFMLGQNYTGSTLIHRTGAGGGPSNALLDFRSTLASGTSAGNPIEVYGRLLAVGAGTFTNTAGSQVNTNVLLRPGSELVLDYNNNASNNTTFLVPLGATSATGFLNKWGDTQAMTLDGAMLRVASAPSSLTTEIIGSVTYKGGAEIFPQSTGTGGNSVVIINGTLSRGSQASGPALGVLALRSGASRLGVPGEPGTNDGQRVVFNSLANATSSGVVRQTVLSGTAAGTTINMVPPRFFDFGANAFLDYAPTTVLGFSEVPFTAAGAFPVTANNGTEIIDNTATVTVNTASDIWALRTSGNNISGTGAITIRSGGLANTATMTIANAVIFSNNGAVEADIWTVSSGNTMTLSGAVTAANLVKNGPGNLALSGNNVGLTGAIQVNGGILRLDTPAATGTTTSIRLHAGNFNNAGQQMPQLNLQNDAAQTYTQQVVISEFVPFATISVDRISANTNLTQTVSGGLTIEGGGSDGTVLAFVNGNDFDFTSSGTTTLGLAGNTARIGINVTNSNATNTVTFSGKVTGPAPMVKSGNGPLVIRYTNAANPQNDFTGGVTLNDGTLQLRNDTATTALTTLGTGAIEINRGTLQLISDTTNTNFASNTGNNLIVRGQAVVQIDRVGANTPLLLLGGDTSTFTTQNSPTIQIQTASGTVTGGAWAGKTVIHDSPTFNLASTAFQLGNAAGSDTISGTGHIYKTGNNILSFNSGAANTFSGGLDIFQGQVRAISNTDTFGTGAVRVGPSGVLGVQAVANVSSNTQVANFHSSSTALAGLALRTTGLAATSFLNATNITTGLVGGATGAGNGGLLAIDTTYTSAGPAINLSTLFDGNWFLGSTTSGTYQATLTAGAGSTYRLGGGGNTLTLNTTNNILTGANSLLVGKPHALAGNGTVVLSTGSNYTGGTTISRVRDTGGNFVVAQVNVQQGYLAGGLGTSGAVDVFGNVQFEAANGSAVNVSGGNRNTYTFHPGARLIFSNTTAYTQFANTAGRWDDATAIALRSSDVEIIGNATTSTFDTETVGAVTFEGGSEIRSSRTTSGYSELIISGTLSRNGTGTLTLTHDVGLLGVAGTANANRVVVTGGVAMTNNMVAPYMVSRSDNQFLKYDPTNGLQIVTGGSGAPANYIASTATTLTATLNNGTEIFSNDAAAATTLGANLDVYALRTQHDISPSANGQFSAITIRSGGLTLAGAARTINANLIFGTAASPAEALIHASVGNLTINGQMTASSVTKFGTSSITINQDQALTGAWNVNQGLVIVQTPGGLGTGVVNLNGWTGNTGQTQTELRFVFNPGTPDELSFSSGKITATDMNLIRSTMGSVNDRVARIAAIDLATTNAVKGTGVPGLLRFQVDNLRNLLRTGAMTLLDDYVVHVDATSFGPGSTTGVRPDAINNGGLYNLTKIGDGVLVLGDNSTTFTGTGKTFTVNEGAVKALSNGSLGGSGTVAIIDNGGTLEIATPGFSPAATLVQRTGSIERWAVNGARSGTVNLPAGVHLQVAANQTGTQTINLNGGSIMGYLPLDVDEVAVFHRLGPNVSVNLQADSMIGQPYPAGTNVVSGSANHIYYDMGKQNQMNNPLNPVLNGSVLEVRGSISAATNQTLTKVGQDLVQLSGTNSGFNTTVREGVLVLGSSSALPSNKTLTMAGSGTLDLNGFNATTGTLAGSSPQSLIVNSASTMNTLTVNGGTSYVGSLSGNLGFVKAGAGDFTLGATPTSGAILAHSGPTTVMTGKLIVAANASGTTTFQVNGGATLDVSSVAGGFQLISAQQLTGGSGATTGTVLGSVTAKAGSTIAPGFDPNLTGILSIQSGLSLESGSRFKLELISGPVAGTGFDQLIVQSGTLSLAGSLDGAVAQGSVQVGDVYYLILHNTGTNTGTFAGLPQSSFLTIDGYEFQISYTADFGGGGFASISGNDVALLVTVPEPGSLAGLCAGLGSLLGLRRFRRRD